TSWMKSVPQSTRSTTGCPALGGSSLRRSRHTGRHGSASIPRGGCRDLRVYFGLKVWYPHTQKRRLRCPRSPFSVGHGCEPSTLAAMMLCLPSPALLHRSDSFISCPTG